MNVLFVSNLFPNIHEPARGVFNFHQIRHLANICQVQVVAPIAWFPIKGRFAPPAPVPVFEEIPLCPELFSTVTHQLSTSWNQRSPVSSRQSQVIRTYHPRQYYLPKIGRILNPLLYALSLRRLVTGLRASFPFDVIFVNWAYPDACGIAKLARRLNIPFVVSISGSDVNWYLKMPLRRRQILAMLAQAHAVAVRSRALKDLLLSHGIPESKIHVLYNGVDREMFHLRPPTVTSPPAELNPQPSTAGNRLQTMDSGLRTQDSGLPPRCAPVSDRALQPTEGLQSPVSRHKSPLLLYVGRLSPEKGVADLLDALAQLTDVRLAVVGDGPQRAQLQQLADTLKISSQITWHGQKKPDEIADFMQGADLLCLPSHMEGVPNVALEAFACGLPVVGTTVGGIPEVVTNDTGVLTAPRDPPALAQAIAQALARRWDSVAIRAHSARFDWTENANQLFALLQAATQSHSSPGGTTPTSSRGP